MPLAAGTRLGPYVIEAPLGAGGMGEVYRATDTRLGREVAIKISAERFSDRFDREARAVAALNHPHICTLHDVGPSYLVMELVEGDTLAERIRQGPVALAEAFRIATEIAQALEAAHDKGIVHRDLKPGNVKIKPDGTVKVLDFGLAKTLARPEGLRSADGGAQAFSPGLLADSPTFAGATEAGMILGTAAYMSPEQARGKPVDKRTDIWAFGCILFEMLTGKQAFGGETVTDVLAALMKNEPDWTAVPPETPRLVRSVLRRCLHKDPARRLHDIADARIEIQEAMSEPDTAAPGLPAARRRGTANGLVPWILVAVLGVAVVGLGILRRGGGAPSSRPVTRLELNLPAGVEPYVGSNSVAFSPDGTRVGFVGIVNGNRQVYVRRLDQFDATLVKGTDGATAVFFSPDGRSIAAILTSGLLAKVSLDDGLVVTLLRDADINSGGVWGPDDRITFGRKNVLWQLPASGGPPTQLTTLAGEKRELVHAFPTVVAGGKAILFTVVTGSGRGAAHIESLSPGTSQRRVVVESGANPFYAPSGHLIFFRDSALLAVAFDEKRLQVTGAPVRLLDAVRISSFGAAMVGVSQTGSVAYMSGVATSQLVSVSRQGVEQRLSDTERSYGFPSLSPSDGRRLVVASDGDIWIMDTERAGLTRLTSSDVTAANSFPVWTPDGKRVIFRTNIGLHWVDAEGSGRSQAIPGTSVADYPNSVSPDGAWLAFLRIGGDKSGDVYVVGLRDDSKPRPLVNTSAYEGGAQFSPDGRWVAFASDESGHFQVFLRPFAGPDRKWLVSQSGKYPRWSRNGKEMFYRDGNRMMVVDVSVSNDEPVFSAPRLLFEQRYQFGMGQTTANYDVSPDGQRFVMVKDESASNRLNVVLNWHQELTRLAPPGR